MFSILGAFVGYMIYRFPGAIAGFFIGSFIDRVGSKKQGGKKRTFGDIFQQEPQRSRGDQVSPADFELNFCFSLNSIIFLSVRHTCILSINNRYKLTSFKV